MTDLEKYRDEIDVIDCEIVRLWFKSGWRYYVNLYLKGDSPEKLTPYLRYRKKGGISHG